MYIGAILDFILCFEVRNYSRKAATHNQPLSRSQRVFMVPSVSWCSPTYLT